MKIIHIPFCFYPDPIGGTEVYVEALATNLQRQGINSPIAAPGNINQSYQHGSLTVHRFALSSTLNLRDLYGLGDSKAAQNFNKILDQEKPDLVHLHAFTSGVSFRLVQAAKQRHIPVMFTYHTPTVSCQRGTLLYNGTEICEGKLDRFTCTSCTLQGMGINSRVSQGVANLGFPFTHWLETLNLQGGIWTALRMGELVQCRQQAFSQLMAEADRIIAVCNWVKELLLLNQIPENKITVLRQGLCHPSSSLSLPVKSPLMAPNEQPRSLKLVFLGRLDPTKGLHLLIQALAQLVHLPIYLDVYGVSQATSSNIYQQQIQVQAQSNPRICFLPPVAPTAVVQTIAQYDLLVVPSQWLETGPLVVLEAFAAGVPAIGSRLGGIAELIRDGINGMLVEPASVQDWASQIEAVYNDRSLLERLRSGITPPTSMQDVATKMVELYKDVIKPTSVTIV